jgi:hypothetical protein
MYPRWKRQEILIRFWCGNVNTPLQQQVGDNIKNNFREIGFGKWELTVTGMR